MYDKEINKMYLIIEKIQDHLANVYGNLNEVECILKDHAMIRLDCMYANNHLLKLRGFVDCVLDGVKNLEESKKQYVFDPNRSRLVTRHKLDHRVYSKLGLPVLVLEFLPRSKKNSQFFTFETLEINTGHPACQYLSIDLDLPHGTFVNYYYQAEGLAKEPLGSAYTVEIYKKEAL